MTVDSNIQLSDLYNLLKAVEVANNKGSFNELEIMAFKPSFDKVHAFLVVQQELAKAASIAASTPTESTDLVINDVITTDITEE